jgi:hypothetical protein
MIDLFQSSAQTNPNFNFYYALAIDALNNKEEALSRIILPFFHILTNR